MQSFRTPFCTTFHQDVVRLRLEAMHKRKSLPEFDPNTPEHQSDIEWTKDPRNEHVLAGNWEEVRQIDLERKEVLLAQLVTSQELQAFAKLEDKASQAEARVALVLPGFLAKERPGEKDLAELASAHEEHARALTAVAVARSNLSTLHTRAHGIHKKLVSQHAHAHANPDTIHPRELAWASRPHTKAMLEGNAEGVRAAYEAERQEKIEIARLIAEAEAALAAEIEHIRLEEIEVKRIEAERLRLEQLEAQRLADLPEKLEADRLQTERNAFLGIGEEQPTAKELPEDDRPTSVGEAPPEADLPPAEEPHLPTVPEL